jgi:hypothetical protein
VVSEGSERSAEFFDGIFQVLQAAQEHAATVLKLVGALENCDGSSPDQPRGRQVWGHGEGLHRTLGTRSSASVRGTEWLVHDRCDGSTLTKVREGVVDVRDFAKHKTVEVKAGDSYVAGP